MFIIIGCHSYWGRVKAKANTDGVFRDIKRKNQCLGETKAFSYYL